MVKDLERFAQWCGRKPGVASLVAVTIVAALAGTTVALLVSEKARAERAALMAKAIADEDSKEAETERLEILYASEPFLVERVFHAGDMASAKELLAGLDAAVARRPTRAILWCARAAASLAMGDRERALVEFTRSIDLTLSTPGAKTPKDALLRRSALLRELGRSGEAGQDHRRAFDLPLAKADSVNKLPDFQNATEVSVEFGQTNREAGLYFLSGSDSKHRSAVTNGEEAEFFREGWNYAYFFIDPTFKWKLGSNVLIRVEYQLVKGQPIGLHYDGARNAFAPATKSVQPPVDHWQVIEFVLRDARFSHRQNLHADFRVYDNERGFYLKRVTVSRYQPSPLIIPLRDPAMSPTMIDLTAFYNGSGRHYAPGGKVEGLADLREEVRKNTGVDFDVRGYVGLFRVGQESDGVAAPAAITGIPIGRRLTKMHFLHSASYKVNDGTRIGAYLLRMADGSTCELPLVYGQHVRIERSDSRATPGAELAWTGEGIRTGAGTTVRILKMTWTNPQPALIVESLDFTSTKTSCAPHLLGITIE